MQIFDAHLDLAMNALLGRDITKPAAQQPARDNEIATVGLPNLRAGRVTNICATIFCQPDMPGHPGYTNPEEAHTQCLEQLYVYDDLCAAGEIALKTSQTATPHAIILLEGSEAIRTLADVAALYERGVRIVGMAWKATRYCGGTGQPGPITQAGAQLVKELDYHHIIHDASHLAEQSFWDLVRLTDRPIIASHSNCRSIVKDDPNERHLTDDMIKAIIARDGVVGINFFDKFLLPASEYGKRRVQLTDVVQHIQHVCTLAGDTMHVGIGTDMDGGLGRDQIPEEIHSSSDLPKLAAALQAAGFATSDVQNILFNNWNRFFTTHIALQ